MMQREHRVRQGWERKRRLKEGMGIPQEGKLLWRDCG